MAKVTVKRHHEICCGHRVHGHEGKCKHLHGHNYRFEFTCRAKTGALDSIGRVIDFSEIKTRLCDWLEDNWDHHFLIWDDDPMALYLLELDPTICLVPFNPTAECIAEYFVEIVAPAQFTGTDIELCELTIYETGKCSATYSKD
jgi:6-pyruvoyltetrahydropterin/6-carboxytetrahydropterin synthase